MDDNPFKPSAYEARPAPAAPAASFDFYPSSTSYQPSAPNSNNVGRTTSPATEIPHFGFPESYEPPNDNPSGDDAAAKAIEGTKKLMAHPVWTWKFWQSFFDVDTTEVVRRILLSFLPYPKYLKSESVEAFVGDKPDLYGPFWIGTTLVFLIAALGNVASYFQTHGKTGSEWAYDFTQLTTAAICIFVYIWVVPLTIWTVMWWMKIHGTLKLSGALCVYGYSMFLYIPVSFLWLIDFFWVKWVSALTAATLSGIILAYIFWNHLHYSHRGSAYIFALVIFVIHLALGFGFVLSFFHYKTPPPPPVDNSTTTMSTTLVTELHGINLTTTILSAKPGDKPQALALVTLSSPGNPGFVNGSDSTAKPQLTPANENNTNSGTTDKSSGGGPKSAFPLGVTGKNSTDTASTEPVKASPAMSGGSSPNGGRVIPKADKSGFGPGRSFLSSNTA